MFLIVFGYVALYVLWELYVRNEFHVYRQDASSRELKRVLPPMEFRRFLGALRQLSNEAGGSVLPGANPGTPRWIFQRNGLKAMLVLQNVGGGGQDGGKGPRLSTRMVVRMPPGWNHRVELYPQETESPPQYLRIQDIQVGESEFDRSFVIKGEDEAFVRRFLDEPIRKAIRGIRELSPWAWAMVSLNRERLIVSAGGVLADVDHLRRFLSLSDTLVERVVQIVDEEMGMQVVAASEEGGMPVCNVCGTEIPPDDRALCRRCRTPSHRDCWAYNKGCAVFGCGESRAA